MARENLDRYALAARIHDLLAPELGAEGWDLVDVRIFRGGGLTKDAVYLRGFREILAYLARGGHPTTLLAGKMAVGHAPIVKELLLRQVLRDQDAGAHRVLEVV